MSYTRPRGVHKVLWDVYQRLEKHKIECVLEPGEGSKQESVEIDRKANAKFRVWVESWVLPDLREALAKTERKPSPKLKARQESSQK